MPSSDLAASQRAAALTLDPVRRAQRALWAAEAKQLAGAPQEALMLLSSAADGPLGELDRAMLQRLHGQIALDLRRAADAVPLLLDAARRLTALDPSLARRTYLEALRAASVAGRLGSGTLAAAKAARKAPPLFPILKEMVEREATPLTDRQICDMLSRKGIRIARRTVAKYRAELNILPSTMR